MGTFAAQTALAAFAFALLSLPVCTGAMAKTHSAGNSLEIPRQVGHARAQYHAPAKPSFPLPYVRSRANMKCVDGYTWDPMPTNGMTLPLPCWQSKNG